MSLKLRIKKFFKSTDTGREKGAANMLFFGFQTLQMLKNPKSLKNCHKQE